MFLLFLDITSYKLCLVQLKIIQWNLYQQADTHGTLTSVRLRRGYTWKPFLHLVRIKQ